MAEVKEKGNEKERSARVSAFQTIAVALITSVFTFLGTYITVKQNTNPSSGESIRHLTINDIEESVDTGVQGFRLICYVNGIAYGYPVKDVWGQPGASTGSARFPVEPASEYNVEFEAWLKRGKIELMDSTEMHTIKAGPKEHKYRIGTLEVEYYLN